MVRKLPVIINGGFTWLNELVQFLQILIWLIELNERNWFHDDLYYNNLLFAG